VDQRHSAAADANGAGTADKPFKTIAAAAKTVKAGDTVVIRAGVYREAVTVAADGSAEALITFRSADGERVVVTGADEITRWEKVAGFDGNVFRAPWPHHFIAWNPIGNEDCEVRNCRIAAYRASRPSFSSCSISRWWIFVSSPTNSS